MRPLNQDPRITVDFLLKKLSPMADSEEVNHLRQQLESVDLERNFTRRFRGDTYIVLRASDVWPIAYGRRAESNLPRLKRLCSALTALLWERSALNGDLVFVKKLDEYREWGF